MTVKELIEKLRGMPEEHDVCVYINGEYYHYFFDIEDREQWMGMVHPDGAVTIIMNA